MPVSNEYLLAKFGFDTAENEPCKVCPLSVYRSPRCSIIFGMIILVLNVLLMNLVTAVIVDNAIMSSQAELEVRQRVEAGKRASLVVQIEGLLMDTDSNQDGILTIEEILEADRPVLEKLSEAIGLGQS